MSSLRLQIKPKSGVRGTERSPRMFSIVFLSLVIIVHGSQLDCDENCCNPPADQLAGSLAQYCKCFAKYVEWLNKLQRAAYKKDVSAVYYEVVGNRNLENLAYALHFTSDPTTKLYYNSYVPTNINPNWQHQSKPFEASKIALNRSPKTKRKIVGGDFLLIGSNKYSPLLYLDIDIQETNKNYVSRLRTIYQGKMRDLTEKHLKDCLDLHVIIYTRIMRNQGKDILIDDNFSEGNTMYNELSESDLLVEINRKCNHSAYIVKEKFNSIDIRNKFTSDTDLNSINNKNHFRKNYYQTEYKTSELQLNLETSTFKESSHILESDASKNGLDLAQPTELLKFNERSRESSSDVSVTDTYTPFSTEISVSSYPQISMLNTSTEFGLEISSTGIEDATPSSIIIDTTDVSRTTTTATNFNIEITNKSGNGNQTNFLEATMTLDDMSTISTVDDFIESTTDVPDQPENENNNTISEIKYIEVNVQEKMDSSITITNGTNRTQYLEGEYEIPKVITIEFSNDTIVSEMQGNEEIPNLDFIKPPEDVIVPFSKSNDNTTDLFYRSNENFNNSSKKKEILPSTELKKDFPNVNNNISSDITGKLYFKYGPQYVPAIFVQKSDGQVNVALDVLSLCNKNETSKIIQVLCNALITFR